MEEPKIKESVRGFYAGLAKGQPKRCCQQRKEADPEEADIVRELDMGVSCGNPVALADLKEGEVVLDLGSGGGLDCFLAAKRVKEAGLVIGVDMTPEMIAKAEANKAKLGLKNVEFRLGEIESLPVESGSVDVVISNCVLNLVHDKQAAFKEVYRVLKPGGRAFISDIALLAPLPKDIEEDSEAWAGCISGALPKEDYARLADLAGFSSFQTISETPRHLEGGDERLQGKLLSLSYVLQK